MSALNIEISSVGGPLQASDVEVSSVGDGTITDFGIMHAP